MKLHPIAMALVLVYASHTHAQPRSGNAAPKRTYASTAGGDNVDTRYTYPVNNNDNHRNYDWRYWRPQPELGYNDKRLDERGGDADANLRRDDNLRHDEDLRRDTSDRS